MNIRSINNHMLVQQQKKRSIGQADIVIIGNGIAGLTAAIEARRLTPDKSIVIITDQIHPTINTPALKQFAMGKLAREQLLAYPAGTERAERIHVVNTRVEEIHARSKYVTLQGGQGFGYGALLLATGSLPVGMSKKIPGHNFDGVLTLHRLQDYLDLRRRIGEVNEAAVIGGGVHAIETVMGLLYWGIRVHWLIRSKTFMRGMLDEASSEMVLNNVRKAGVHVHLETEVSGVMGRVGAVAGVITNHSEMIPCQLVLSCTGTKPSTVLAEKSSVPMLLQNGIMVDDKLRTSVRDIYAAGDVAALKNPQTGTFEPRAQWYSATAQGRIAGAMMAGHTEPTNAVQQQPFGVYWHATHLGELSMLTVGEPLSKDPQIQMLTDTSKSDYRRIALQGDRLVGYLALGTTQPDSLAIKRIIEEGISVRDVIKPLLKGQFDARAYLSKQRSRATHNLLMGKSPALLLPPSSTPAQHDTRNNDIFPQTSKQQTDPLRVRPAATPAPLIRETGPLGAGTRPLMPTALDDEFNPFTGNLPAFSLHDQDIQRPLAQPQGLQKPEWPDRVVDASQAGTGKKPLHYKLWSYLDKAEEDIDAYDQASYLL